ncbi:MAG: hypothetical protein JWQ73_1797 [Variovorax sp.]|jgi:hypothetical protein|nr:hypothetical protein [Variovorax sp.]
MIRHRLQALGSSSSQIDARDTDEMAMFTVMQAFRGCGGIFSGDAMAGHLGSYWAQPVSVLARWIVDRRVLHFPWRGTLMLPAFQFEPADGTICSEVTQVIGQLVNVLDGCELVKWFVRPHCLLRGDLPVRLMKANAPLVFEAARATHFAHR